MTENQLFER